MASRLHPSGRAPALLGRGLPAFARQVGALVVLLVVTVTLLFFTLRLTGDPAVVIAGEFATPEALADIRQRYQLDQPLIVQYLTFLEQSVRLNLGSSLATGQSALGMVLARLPATLTLTVAGSAANLAIAVPAGLWIGSRAAKVDGRLAALVAFVFQGLPGYVVALVLIEVATVRLGLLPSIGGDGGLLSLILPSLAIASFLAPKLTRIIAARVREELESDYATLARAHGAGRIAVLIRHAWPNALLGATALFGVQLAGLINGIVITESIFAWPGVGKLLLDSIIVLDFPVVQAVVIVTTLLVFLVNSMTDYGLDRIDPRT
ncbi:MAG: ABC transporter permease subunit [Micromonosporaceae bacterium]|nr:ABC transporter permease subunit [Micromonosporaceae bacterium]